MTHIGKQKISKEELKKADANLIPPTQDIEENLAEGRAALKPDSDDLPVGEKPSGYLRPGMVASEGGAYEEQKEDAIGKKKISSEDEKGEKKG